MIFEVDKQTVRKWTYTFPARFSCLIPKFQQVESLQEISFLFETDNQITPFLIDDMSYEAL